MPCCSVRAPHGSPTTRRTAARSSARARRRGGGVLSLPTLLLTGQLHRQASSWPLRLYIDESVQTTMKWAVHGPRPKPSGARPAGYSKSDMDLSACARCLTAATSSSDSVMPLSSLSYSCSKPCRGEGADQKLFWNVNGSVTVCGLTTCASSVLSDISLPPVPSSTALK